MDRRNFLKRGAAGAGAAGVVALSACGPQASPSDTQGGPAAPAINRQRVRLRVVTTWPKNFPGLGTAPERVAERVAALTGGTLEMQVYAAGELAPAFEAFDVVSSGAADAYHGADYYWQGKSKGFNFFCAAPMGLTAQEYIAWARYGGGQALWDELAGQFDIKPIACGNTGHQMGGWFKREINTLDDFVGLKMRIPGLGGAVIKALGGAPVTLPGSEIYQALQSGAIDATEWVGPWNDLAFGFYREAKLYYGPGFHEPGAQLTFGVNRQVWEGLSRDHQAAIEYACASVNNDSIGEFLQRNGEALRTLVDEHGVQLRSFSDTIWERLGEASEEVVADVALNDGELTRRIYESHNAARANGSRWASLTDAPYLRLRDRILG